MDAETMGGVAAALWAVLATGAGERLGAAGTDEALQLLEHLRKQRVARGESPDFDSVDQLQTELREAQRQQAVQVVTNNFYDRVKATKANFGIEN